MQNMLLKYKVWEWEIAKFKWLWFQRKKQEIHNELLFGLGICRCEFSVSTCRSLYDVLSFLLTLWWQKQLKTFWEAGSPLRVCLLSLKVNLQGDIWRLTFSSVLRIGLWAQNYFSMSRKITYISCVWQV